MGAPKMTHDQFMQALSAKPAPAIRELTFSDKPEPLSMKELRREANNLIRERAREYASEGSDTSGEYRRLAADEMQRLRSNHMGDALRIAQENQLQNFTSPFHGQYTLPGGENYREMLIKAPEEGGEMFGGVGAHFGGEPGVLASMRLKDRLVPDLEGPHNVTIIGGGGVSNKNTYDIFQSFGNKGGQGKPDLTGSPAFSSGGGGGAGRAGSNFSTTTGGGNGGAGKDFISYLSIIFF
jgi:hypothetical protein